MYKAIIFDLDNTLLDYDRCESDSLLMTGGRHGFEQWERFTWEAFRATFDPINWTYWSERVVRKLTIHQVLEYSFRDTLEKLERDKGEAEALARTYWEHFCAICHFEEGAPELLADLHGSRKLAVVSNGIGEAQRRRTASGGIDHLFDAFVVSDEVGLWKPDRTIFEVALRELGLDRSEVLFVGDSLQDDYAGARNAGIDFCFYNRKRVTLDRGYEPDYVIERIGDIRGVLSGER
ncbi:HAD family hydrolase [Paenibacillus flagellatus]|uniref:Haloacid dehalogenase n=1 Tax=Paenibacillus flagellatus TaxID=2211139 RepID=A0A2V5KCF8_9BACL|nr:HAD-IA family hydrolase [Paenibacillus flagellatus]PYI51570.1 haloacid dehalogenase [Paenibacillus flagellatus]